MNRQVGEVVEREARVEEGGRGRVSLERRGERRIASLTSKQVDNLFGIISALSKLIARDTEMADNSKAKIKILPG